MWPSLWVLQLTIDLGRRIGVAGNGWPPPLLSNCHSKVELRCKGCKWRSKWRVCFSLRNDIGLSNCVTLLCVYF